MAETNKTAGVVAVVIGVIFILGTALVYPQNIPWWAIVSGILIGIFCVICGIVFYSIPEKRDSEGSRT